MSKDPSDHSVKATLTRRELVGGAANLGLLAAGGMLAGSATAGTDAGKAKLDGQWPAQGEYLIRGGYVMSLDQGIGDLDGGDVHVRNGEIVAVAGSISAPGAEVIDAAGMIVIVVSPPVLQSTGTWLAKSPITPW